MARKNRVENQQAKGGARAKGAKNRGFQLSWPVLASVRFWLILRPTPSRASYRSGTMTTDRWMGGGKYSLLNHVVKSIAVLSVAVGIEFIFGRLCMTATQES